MDDVGAGAEGVGLAAGAGGTLDVAGGFTAAAAVGAGGLAAGAPANEATNPSIPAITLWRPLICVLSFAISALRRAISPFSCVCC